MNDDTASRRPADPEWWWVTALTAPTVFFRRNIGSGRILALILSAAVITSTSYYLIVGLSEARNLGITLPTALSWRIANFVCIAALPALYILACAVVCRLLIALIGWGDPSLRELVFVIAWGEVLFGIGLVARLFFLKSHGAEFSFSLAQILEICGANASKPQLIVLSRLDIFVIWELMVVTMGLDEVCAERGFWSRFAITAGAIVVLPAAVHLLLVNHMSHGWQ